MSINVGIIGAGTIAHKMSQTIQAVEGANAYAIASRNAQRAAVFAEKYQFEKAYDSYERMLKDPAVDLVYVATPHSHHYEHARLALERGKAVLCEKPFSVNAEQSKKLIAAAQVKNLFITEAIWTRYLPMRKTLEEILDRKVIGEIFSLSGNLGYPNKDLERMKDPNLAGGALLDLGVYAVHFAFMVFPSQTLRSIHSFAIKTEENVDLQNSFTLQFEDQKMAVLSSSMAAVLDRRGMIHGSEGYIEVDNINHIQQIKVYNKNHELIEEHKAPPEITGFEYELLASIHAIENGKLECEEITHEETIKVMEVMDQLRAEWGMVYPGLEW
ncbi:oxidoreductase [Clostridia bacterium]|nr:oxidoreductase [Clostridia bacterium]